MADAGLYQVVILGKRDARADVITNLTRDRLVDLGVDKKMLRIVPETETEGLDPRLLTIGVFLGYDVADDRAHPFIGKLLENSNMIVTVVSSLGHVSREIPESLRHINAIEAALPDGNFDRIASLILEGFRLLRRERRLFISYKRTDSQAVANQLYDALDARGFDVFIDTRTVPPSADFQAELWHRLSDSDVVVLIDTAGFRSSRWTTEELSRANATNIQILHLLWPGQREDEQSAFSHFHSLAARDFSPMPDGQLHSLSNEAVDSICRHAERLRARALAARYRYLVDSFCDAARDRGLAPSVQPQRWISVELATGKQLAAVPVIGVPTSDQINAVFDAIAATNRANGGTWLLYDSRGMLTSWLQHLGWLDNYLPVKCVGMVRVDQALRKLAA